MGRFPKVFAILTAVLLVAIGGGVIAATMEIETIVFSGPFFSLLGIALCVTWFFHRRGVWAPLVGLSLPALSLIVLWLINYRSWGPVQAAGPVSAILLVYQAAIVAVGLIGIREQMRLRRNSMKAGIQFSIQSLLILTGIVAITLGAVRVALNQGADAALGLAISFTVLTVLGIIAVALYPLPPVEADVVQPKFAPEKKPFALQPAKV